MEKKTHTYFYPETTQREKRLIWQNGIPETRAPVPKVEKKPEEKIEAKPKEVNPRKETGSFLSKITKAFTRPFSNEAKAAVDTGKAAMAAVQARLEQANKQPAPAPVDKNKLVPPKIEIDDEYLFNQPPRPVAKLVPNKIPEPPNTVKPVPVPASRSETARIEPKTTVNAGRDKGMAAPAKAPFPTTKVEKAPASAPTKPKGRIVPEEQIKAQREAESKPVNQIADEFLTDVKERHGLRRKPESYAESLRKLADKGNVMACLALVAAYAGGLFGEAPDPQKAKYWLEQAQALPHTEADQKAIDAQLAIEDKKLKQKEASERVLQRYPELGDRGPVATRGPGEKSVPAPAKAPAPTPPSSRSVEAAKTASVPAPAKTVPAPDNITIIRPLSGAREEADTEWNLIALDLVVAESARDYGTPDQYRDALDRANQAFEKNKFTPEQAKQFLKERNIRRVKFDGKKFVLPSEPETPKAPAKPKVEQAPAPAKVPAPTPPSKPTVTPAPAKPVAKVEQAPAPAKPVAKVEQAPAPTPTQKPTVTPAPTQAPGWRPPPNQNIPGFGRYKADPLRPDEMSPQAPAQAPASAKAPTPAPTQKPTVTPAPAPAPGWRPQPNQIVQGVPYKADPLSPGMFQQAPAKAPAQAKGPVGPATAEKGGVAPRPAPSAPAENPADKLLNQLPAVKKEAVLNAKTEAELEKALADLQANDALVQGLMANQSKDFTDAFNAKFLEKKSPLKVKAEKGPDNLMKLVVDKAAPKPQETDEGRKLNFKEIKGIIEAVKEFITWLLSKLRETRLEMGDIPTLESEIAILKKKEGELKLKPNDPKAKEELKQVTEQRVKLEARLKEMKDKYNEAFGKIKPLTESQIVAFNAYQDKYGRVYVISKPGREAEALPQVRYVVRASYPEGVRPPVVQDVGRPVYLVNVYNINIGNVIQDVKGNVSVSGSVLQGAAAEAGRPSAVRRSPVDTLPPDVAFVSPTPPQATGSAKPTESARPRLG